MTKQFDAIVIGTGQSGPPLAGRLSREGLKTAVIERKLVGGTCVNVGCVPTKNARGKRESGLHRKTGPEFRCRCRWIHYGRYGTGQETHGLDCRCIE